MFYFYCAYFNYSTVIFYSLIIFSHHILAVCFLLSIVLRKYLNLCMFDWSGKNWETSGKGQGKVREFWYLVRVSTLYTGWSHLPRPTWTTTDVLNYAKRSCCHPGTPRISPNVPEQISLCTYTEATRLRKWKQTLKNRKHRLCMYVLDL